MNHTKLKFRLESGEVESLWAIVQPDGLELANIPFYVREVALGDVVSAKPDGDDCLWFDALVRASGHSTVRLWFAEEGDVPRVRAYLDGRGCGSELSDLSRLVAVDIPPTIDYGSIRPYFDEGEAKGVFEYEEGCLGFRQGQT
jgi:hypothetical protein